MSSRNATVSTEKSVFMVFFFIKEHEARSLMKFAKSQSIEQGISVGEGSVVTSLDSVRLRRDF
jgi:hypothetical protein